MRCVWAAVRHVWKHEEARADAHRGEAVRVWRVWAVVQREWKHEPPPHAAGALLPLSCTQDEGPVPPVECRHLATPVGCAGAVPCRGACRRCAGEKCLTFGWVRRVLSWGHREVCGLSCRSSGGLRSVRAPKQALHFTDMREKRASAWGRRAGSSYTPQQTLFTQPAKYSLGKRRQVTSPALASCAGLAVGVWPPPTPATCCCVALYSVWGSVAGVGAGHGLWPYVRGGGGRARRDGWRGAATVTRKQCPAHLP